MIHEFAHALRPTRFRSVALVLLAVLAGASCDNTTEPIATAAPRDPTAPVALPEARSLTPAFSTISYSGRAYGPVNLWNSNTTVSWGPYPFTGSKNPSGSGGLVTQISAARQKKHRLVLSMTDGPSSNYMSSGKFDMTKWKSKMNSFNTATIRNAVAAAVSDGTVIGNQLIDEPEIARWNGSVSKATIDAMATYARNIFPTLPMGINVGPPAYKWRSSEQFHKLDFVRYQYSWYITSGNVASWRDAVIQRASVDHVTPAFSVNILDGGVPDKSGSSDCRGPAARGPMPISAA